MENTATEKSVKAQRREEKNQALIVLKELVDKQTDPKYKKAMIAIRPSMYGVVRAGGSNQTEKFIQYMAEKGQAKEDIVFREFKYGRKDCAGQIRKHLKKSEPANRVWISFNAETETYKVEGKGAKAPANWTGYEPAEEVLNVEKPVLR